jgi:ferric-dicitrate binding protein FerR (iron transport regulator)
MENEKRIGYLFHQARTGALTVAEKEELTQLLASSPAMNALFQQDVIESKIFSEHLKVAYSMDEEYVREGIQQHIDRSRNLTRTRYIGIRRWAMAAAIMSSLSIGIWFMVTKLRSVNSSAIGSPNPTRSDIPPGKNRAVLTLADNTLIDLDSVSGGQIASQGSTKIMKSQDGSLHYNMAKAAVIGTNGIAEVAYNILRTPIAGQYELVLPDGSLVWLNNASQLRYPVAFVGKERVVELVGEGYFQVTRDKAKPFVVKVGGQQIRVLGTSFNITAYPDEPAVRTVLEEGSVKVSLGEQAAVLKPGLQSANVQGLLEVKEVNVRSAIAWRRGFFSFDNATVQSVLTQICRWYGVALDKGVIDISQKRLEGEIPRNETLLSVLVILKKHGVECELVNGTTLKVIKVIR